MAKRAKESYTIQSVVHALDLLEQFHGEESEIGVTELSRRLGLHKNNVFRLLATLETHGYVVQNPDSEGYHLGVKALELGRSYLRHADIVALAGPTLAELRDQTRETAYLAVLQGEDAVFVLAEESPQSVRVSSLIGQHHPAITTAAGRAQLAYLTTLPYTNHPLRRITDPRPADLRKLELELQRVRELGYAVDEAGLDREIVCVAAPVFNDERHVVGAVAVHAPAFRVVRDNLQQAMIDKVTAAAKAMSQSLGHKAITAVAASVASAAASAG